MSVLATVVIVLLAWLVAALVVGVVVGRAIRRRDRQVPGRAAPEPVVVPTPAVPGSAVPGSVVSEPVRPAAADAELRRLLAALDRAEGASGPAGTADEIADLVRIWTARSASSSAERELNRAIEAARRNGHSRDAIRAVLELPLPGTLESSPD